MFSYFNTIPVCDEQRNRQRMDGRKKLITIPKLHSVWLCMRTRDIWKVWAITDDWWRRIWCDMSIITVAHKCQSSYTEVRNTTICCVAGFCVGRLALMGHCSLNNSDYNQTRLKLANTSLVVLETADLVSRPLETDFLRSWSWSWHWWSWSWSR